MTLYIALLRKDKDSDFGVDFPDFPGCVTAGRTFDEIKDLAAEALAFHVEGMVEDGDAIPDPTSIDVITANPDNHDAVVLLVDLPAKREKKERYNITMAPSVMAQIEAAVTAGLAANRSAFLTAAAIEKIKREHVS